MSYRAATLSKLSAPPLEPVRWVFWHKTRLEGHVCAEIGPYRAWFDARARAAVLLQCDPGALVGGQVDADGVGARRSRHTSPSKGS